MLTPQAKLIWLAALTVVPACAWAGLSPVALLPALAVVLVFGMGTALDAIRGARQLRPITIATLRNEATWIVDRPASIDLELTGRAGDYQLSLDLPPDIEQPATPTRVTLEGTPVRPAVACLPRQRGRFALTTCFVRRSSPLGFWNIATGRALAQTIRVLPDLDREPGSKLLFNRRRLGIRPQPLTGRGREFDRLREYAPGDSYDEIDWKATARRREPVVKVFQIERTQDVYVLLDASRFSLHRGKLDSFINAALMVALATEHEGDNFGLAAFHDQVIQFVPARPGKGHFARCREAIFDLQASRVTPDFDELFSFLQLSVRRRSLLLFLTDLSDPLASETFQRNIRMLSRKHVVSVGYPRDPNVRPVFSEYAADDMDSSDGETLYRHLAGHLQWASWQQAEKTLRQNGVRVVSLRPAAVGLDLTAHYSDIKRRQLL